MTLCCAPDWMKGGEPGETDWSRIEVAPDPAHYADFAALAVDVARRYPQVRHFVVWNELKGFFDATADAGTSSRTRSCTTPSTARSRRTTRRCRWAARTW
ncbi:hypothetical protein BJF78_29420 [Pseudonocardia sp. CNS-139]|nr:hypothetical protein BJF78_29420 [Pseudonocardia sp. CNS-139]